MRSAAEEFAEETGTTFEPVFHKALRQEKHAQISGHQRDDSLLAQGFPIPYPQGADTNALITIFIEEAGKAWPELTLPLRSEVAGKDFRRWHICYNFGGGIANGAHTIMRELRRVGLPTIEYFYEPQFVTREDPSPWRRHEWMDAPDPDRLVKSFYNDAWFDPEDGHGYLDLGGGRKARMLHIGDAPDEAALIEHWNQGTSTFGSKGLAPPLLGRSDPGFPGDMADGTGPTKHEIRHMYHDSHVSPFRDTEGWVIRTTHMINPYDGELQMITMRNGETLLKRVMTIRLTSTEVGHGSMPFVQWGRFHLYGEGFDIINVRPGELDVIRGQDGVFFDSDGIPAGAWHYAGKDLVYLDRKPWSPFQIEQLKHDGAMWLRPVEVTPPLPPPDPEPDPIRVLIGISIAEGSSIVLKDRDTIQLTLIGEYSVGGASIVEADKWDSSWKRVATVTGGGEVKARKKGRARVTAWKDQFSTYTDILVQ